ncbi:MAG: sulfite exporter TauE/SafE family protein [Candidatus Binataceae bacterium]
MTLSGAAPLIGAAAAFMAAFVNAIAGGGTFIAFPTLTGVIGLTEKLANATCTVGLWPGYASSVAAARDELASIPRKPLTKLVMVSVVGGAVGGAMLLLTSAALFRTIVPILLGVGTILFASGPIVNRRFNPDAAQETPQGAALPVLFVVAIYNGYFGAGGGVLVMAGLAVCGLHDARRANIFKMLVQVTSNAAAVAVLAWSAINGPVALGMMPGAIAGGWFGMRLANVMPRALLRAIIILCGVVLTVVYTVKLFR